ncbi:unnamed protein product [Bursaphelenchus okinawaensis]|uniref:Uncharacterized protein n=1 Tax=Bursaphelenchus okinawaensis TaxID=465554 RepID=A0A811KUW8_9BILA|nr:unnamed protein product [Bursaphelenchus okinawaensis]CAG9111256.1 unnamed protein product [Bursaphelenchus okinawaensis]
MNKTLNFLFILIVHLVIAQNPLDIDLEADLSTLNQNTLKEFNEQWNGTPASERSQLLQRLGKIALFMRLYRKFAPDPNNGKVEFEYLFPKPEPAFHKEILDKCNDNIKVCINFVMDNLYQRFPTLFPTHFYEPDFSLDAQTFTQFLDKNQQRFDVTIAYLFCWSTKNKLEALEYMPFCSYDPDGPLTMFPADRFRENKFRKEIKVKMAEVMDNMFELEPFECATKSFCPNPCCGNGDNNTCAHPVCSPANSKSECVLSDDLNTNIKGLVANHWNITCGCDEPGFVYRFDTEQCVDVDECRVTECAGTF